MQDLPRHQHSDPRLSVSFQSQTRWMAGEWKSWLKPNPIPLLPSTVRERPSILFATTLMPRGPPPPRYSTLRSRIILLPVSPFAKYKYIRRIYSSYIYNISTIYSYSYVIFLHKHCNNCVICTYVGYFVIGVHEFWLRKLFKIKKILGQ